MSYNSFENTRHGDMSKQPLWRPSKRKYVKGSRERVEKETRDMLMLGQTRKEKVLSSIPTHESKFCLLTGHFENRLFRISCLPSNICGMTNISSDISSIRLFWSGVPVSRIRCSA
jgi:hypothetical protein